MLVPFEHFSTTTQIAHKVIIWKIARLQENVIYLVFAIDLRSWVIKDVKHNCQRLPSNLCVELFSKKPAQCVGPSDDVRLTGG